MNTIPPHTNLRLLRWFYFFNNLLYGPETTAAETLKQQAFTDEQRATLASLESLAASLLHGLFAVFIGLVADQIGPICSLLVIELFFTTTILCVWRLYRSMRR